MRRFAILALLAATSCSSGPDPEKSQLPDLYAFETPAKPAAKSAGPAEHVVIISIDGLRPDAIEATAPKNMLGLIRRGAYCDRAQTIRPSITFLSHTSMLTGLDFPKHGVVWNNYRPGLISCPTVFSEVGRAGLTCAIYYAKEKFKYLSDVRILQRIYGPPPPKKIPELQDYSDPKYVEKEESRYRRTGAAEVSTRTGVTRPGDPQTSALGLARQFAEDWPAHGFSLTFIHLREPDEHGHRWGWMRDGYMESILTCDRAIGVILEAIRSSGRLEKTAVILTADHGGSGRDHFAARDRDRPENVTIPWICAGPGVKPGVRIDRVIRTMDTMPTALAFLGVRPPQEIDGKVVEEVLR